MINAHGGTLKKLQCSYKEKKHYLQCVNNFFIIDIEDRYAHDVEMISDGAFSPLDGFMSKKECESVLDTMKLPDGTLWSIPIVLPIPQIFLKDIHLGQKILLRNKGKILAVLKIEDIFSLDIEIFCKKLFATNDSAHPGVQYMKNIPNFFIGGAIKQIQKIEKPSDLKYLLTPQQTRRLFQKKGWKTIVAFQTRNVFHRAHEYIQQKVLESFDALLIHPLIGVTKSDDVPSDVRMKTYEFYKKKIFTSKNVILSFLRTNMYYAGPKEAVHHAIIRKNYGCTHIIIGRDHAGVANYYGTYEAQDCIKEIQSMINIKPVFFEDVFYCTQCASMTTDSECHHLNDRISFSASFIRKKILQGDVNMELFMRPEVHKILKNSYKAITND